MENLSGWLTTVVGRVCLDMLRSRGSRREDPLEYFVPDPVVTVLDATNPEHTAELTESVGLALLVVLETLSPAERLAFVLHDMFAVSFDEIARIVDRTPAATRQLASRARRRVQDATPAPGPDARRQREIADAFLAAANGGDFEGLLAVLDPDVVLRADGGRVLAAASKVVRGAEAVISQALMYAKFKQRRCRSWSTARPRSSRSWTAARPCSCRSRSPGTGSSASRSWRTRSGSPRSTSRTRTWPARRSEPAPRGGFRGRATF
ncbi:hypothetical protein SNARM312S_07340 [Streptomyces narbonensis]